MAGVITRRASRFHSDFTDIASIAESRQIPVLFAEDNDAAQQDEWLRARKPDLLFVVGWSQLLPEAMLKIPPRGAIGFHPAALPENRGRHPIIWALALGLSGTASSFFLMGAGVDDGPVVSQYPVAISPNDTAETLYRKILALIPRQIEEIVISLENSNLMPKPQDKALATYWRKRSVEDGRIDWRMSAAGIYNLVRALSSPYPGAHFTYRGQPVKVWHCAIEPAAPANAEPGKVLAVTGGEIVVKTGEQAVRLIRHEIPSLPLEGEYL
jgi:methionyl-tRNA formyltransferase